MLRIKKMLIKEKPHMNEAGFKKAFSNYGIIFLF